MITFSKLGQKGNLGNQLFQIASTIGMARANGRNFRFPKWQFADSFKHTLPENSLPGAISVNEKTYHYTPLSLPTPNDYDLNGWFQTSKYWNHCEAEVRKQFEFKDEIMQDVKNKYPDYEKAVCISIRRGDFVNNPNYYQLSIIYYILALFEYFPDWQSRKLYLFSDDLDYCKHHFGHLENAMFVEEKPIMQLALGSLCSNFVISNSTFSWWLAYLSCAGEFATVIRPIKNMSGQLAIKNDEKDYWQESWIVFSHEGKKINLKDTTFTIPLYYDHEDRRHNANLSVCLLQRDFDTNILIGEQGSNKFEYFSKYGIKYKSYPAAKMQHFHRTKMLNDMAYEAETPYVINWDIDTVLPPLRVWSAVNALREGAEIVYPFDGRVYHVPRDPNFVKLEKSLDTGIFGMETFKGKNGHEVTSSVGHAVFVNKEAFILAGMENEKMISYGPEDCERWDRFKLLGLQVERINGPMYHIEHWRGRNSTSNSPFFDRNHKILAEQRELTKEQLQAEINTWQWVNKYTEAYYGRISPGAIVSSKEVFAALAAIGIKPKTVLDVGCGVGEWSKGTDAEYFGIDKGVMERALIFPKDHFQDCDLTKAKLMPFADKSKFDLVLCLEVAEHLPASKAETLVAFLTSYSNIILFSAAIPKQGGLDHINEQWQTYWAEIFARFGYYPAKKQPDIRNNEKIEVWYRQNILLYQKGAKGGKVEKYVHPQMWLNCTKK